MNFLTASLSLSIGCAVAWLLALYTARGVALLVWDMLFAIAGTVVTALAIAWAFPAAGLAALLIAGPLVAALAIFAGHAFRVRVIRALGVGEKGSR